MVKCPKCQQQPPLAKMIFLGFGKSLACPICHTSLELENATALGLISYILAGIVVGLCEEVSERAGHPWSRQWIFITIFWMALLISVPIRAFFLRMRIKTPDDRPLNL
jgi:hypothetical protein